MASSKMRMFAAAVAAVFMLSDIAAAMPIAPMSDSSGISPILVRGGRGGGGARGGFHGGGGSGFHGGVARGGAYHGGGSSRRRLIAAAPIVARLIAAAPIAAVVRLSSADAAPGDAAMAGRPAERSRPAPPSGS